MKNDNAKIACQSAREELISKIAEAELGIETLEARKSDSLDFYDLPVWKIKEALIAAFEAGRKSQS